MLIISKYKKLCFDLPVMVTPTLPSWLKTISAISSCPLKVQPVVCSVGIVLYNSKPKRNKQNRVASSGRHNNSVIINETILTAGSSIHPVGFMSSMLTPLLPGKRNKESNILSRKSRFVKHRISQ